MIATIIPTDLVTNSFLSYICPFLQTKNKNHVFMFQSIDFYKGIFLYVIPARIIVP